MAVVALIGGQWEASELPGFGAEITCWVLSLLCVKRENSWGNVRSCLHFDDVVLYRSYF